MRYPVFLWTLFICLNGSAQSLDIRLLYNVNHKEYPKWDKAMKTTSASVYPAMVVAPGSLLLTGYLRKDKVMIRNGVKTCIAIALTTSLNTGLKYSFKIERPYFSTTNGIIKRTDTGPYSFPSGHTAVAFAIATSMSLSTKKWYVAIPSYIYAGTVGYSRMRLGVHYPSDVLGGIIVGTGSALLVWKIDQWINKKKDIKKIIN